MITSGLRSIACRITEGQETRKKRHTCGGCLSTGTQRFIHRHARQPDTTPACAREQFNRDSKTGIYTHRAKSKANDTDITGFLDRRNPDGGATRELEGSLAIHHEGFKPMTADYEVVSLNRSERRPASAKRLSLVGNQCAS
jgi:hypothetical protein